MSMKDHTDGPPPLHQGFDPDSYDEAQDELPRDRHDENGEPLGESIMREVNEFFGDDEIDGRTAEDRDPAVTPTSEDGAR